MKKLPVTPSRREILWGAVYMGAEYLLLPPILVLINDRLPTPLSVGQLNCLLFLINFLAVLVIFRSFLKQTLTRIPSGVLGAALRGFGLYFLLTLGVSQGILWIDPEFANVNDAAIGQMAGEDFLLITLCTVIPVPIAEELLFRGILFGGVYNRSRTAAYALSCSVFALIHIVAYIGAYPVKTLLLCLIQYLPAGIALGWAWSRSGSILSPILMHIAINAIGMLALR